MENQNILSHEEITEYAPLLIWIVKNYKKRGRFDSMNTPYNLKQMATRKAHTHVSTETFDRILSCMGFESKKVRRGLKEVVLYRVKRVSIIRGRHKR